METKFKYNDGGRSLYFSGKGGDCVARAISTASKKDYLFIYNLLAKGNAKQRKGKNQSTNHGKKTALYGINTRRKWFKDLMNELGFEWTPTMKIGQGCTTHLCKEELPKGRLVVVLSKHLTAMIDGVINDTYTPQRIWSRPDDGKKLKSNEWKTLSNNLIHEETRCVYGYYILKTL